MRKLLLLTTILLSTLAAQAQTVREFKQATDSLRARLQRRTSVKSYLKLTKVTKRGTTLDFQFSPELGDYPLRSADVDWIKDQLRALMPSPYRAYTLGNITAKDIPLESLPMPKVTNSGKPMSTSLRVSDPKGKTIPLVRSSETWTKGLSGRHIAL